MDETFWSPKSRQAICQVRPVFFFLKFFGNSEKFSLNQFGSLGGFLQDAGLYCRLQSPVISNVLIEIR